MKIRLSRITGYLVALLLPAAAFAAAATNEYVNLKDKPMWSFDENQNRVIVLIRQTDTIQGKEYYRVEWHNGQIHPTPFYVEYWFAKGDSIFCAGVKSFGGVVFYSKPSLVIANGTNPGDSWSTVVGKAPLCDTLRYTADGVDTLERASGNVAALRITKTSKGFLQRRWFAKGRGLIQETREEAHGSPAPINLK